MTATRSTSRCASCWHEYMPEDRFCPRCGTPVATQKSASDTAESERKRLGGQIWQMEEAPDWSSAGQIELNSRPAPHTRRRRRSRRPGSRLLPLAFSLSVALAILVGGFAGRTLSETGSTIDKLQSVSTPPAQIGDSTVRDALPPEPESQQENTLAQIDEPLSAPVSAGIPSDPVESGAPQSDDTPTQILEIPAPGEVASSTVDSPGTTTTQPGTSDAATSSTDPSMLDGEAEAEALLAAGMTFDTAPAVAAITQHQQASTGSGDASGSAPTSSEEAGSSNNGGLLGTIRDKGSQLRDTAEGAAIAVGVSEPSAEPITIMIMGVDARPGSAIDIGVRPDALMILRLDPQAESCQGLAIPRDSYVELPGYGNTKINHALMLGGIPFQQLVVEQFLGIEIDHYALIDFTGFAELVDAVGGVTIDVSPDLASPTVAAGVQTIDGETALLHARYRGGPDGDFGRIKRQQQIMRGLIAAADGRNLVTEATRLLTGLQDHIRTDMDIDQLVGLATTYQERCTTDGLHMEQIPGEVVYGPLIDPLFNLPLSYVVSDPQVIEESVARLIGE